MARPAATGPLKERAARQMRATAQLLDADHPETVAGDHLRDAARVLEHGSTDGAKRHLDAAMELLTPRNLVRHGILDDDGHSLAKHHLHQVYRHRLHVQDIEDVRLRNDQLRSAARALRGEPQPEPGQQATQLASTVDLVGKKGYVHGWKYVGAGQAPAMGALGLKVNKKGYMRSELPVPGTGPGQHAPGFVGTKGSVFGRKLSLKEAIGASEALGTKSAKETARIRGEQIAAARKQLTKAQRLVFDKLIKRGRSPYGALIIARSVTPGALAAGLANEMDFVGPHGYVHGWIKVGAQGLFAPGTLPGSFEHIRAIDDFAERAGISSGDPAHASPVMRTALHNVAKAVAGRDMHRARVHLAMARWANVHEAGGKHTRELADLHRQLRRVPPGVTGWEGKIKNPLHESMQHPGSIQSSIRPPAHPTRGAMASAQAYAASRPAVELVGPKGFIHGWIKVGGVPGSAGSIDARRVEGSYGHRAAQHIRAASRAERAGDHQAAARHLDAAFTRVAGQVEAAHQGIHDPGQGLLRNISQARVRHAGTRPVKPAKPPAKRPAARPGKKPSWLATFWRGDYRGGSKPLPGGLSAAAVGLTAGDRAAILLSARTAMLERTPAPRGRPGGPGLYDVKGMGHTPYFQNVVKALIEKRGMPKDKAYKIAWGALRKWRRGGGHVHPEVRAAATGALAGEAAKGAQARASHGHAADPMQILDGLIELACEPIGLVGPKGYEHGWIKVENAGDMHGKVVSGRVVPLRPGGYVTGRYSHLTRSVRPRGSGQLVRVDQITTDVSALPAPYQYAVRKQLVQGGFANDQAAIELFNPYHAPPGAGGGQFTTQQGAQQQQQKQKQAKQQAARREGRHDARQRAVLTRRIAGLRSQIAALQAQLPHRTSRSSRPAKKGAAAISAKQAAQAKATAAKTGATTRKTAKAGAARMSPATIHAKIAALRAQLQADLAELRSL